MTRLRYRAGRANSGQKEASGFKNASPLEEEKNPGEKIVLQNRYLIVKKIGEGGMGSVFLANDLKVHGKEVVIKLLPPEFSKNAMYVERFRRETQILASINHPNIVKITDIELNRDPPFYVMEYLQGRTLAKLIREEFLPWDQRTKTIILEICSALEAAHAQGVVHRDIKPGNIFLIRSEIGDKEVVKLLDFGISKLEHAMGNGSRLRWTGNASAITTTAVGTPSYMAPEQADGKADARSDVYALGLVMYEMLCGRHPFIVPKNITGEKLMLEFIRLHKTAEVVKPSQVRPQANIPSEIDEIILKALTKNPEKRFKNISEMRRVIEQCPAPEHIAASKIKLTENGFFFGQSLLGLFEIKRAEVERARRAAKRWRTAILGAFLLAAMAGAYYFGLFQKFGRFIESIKYMNENKIEEKQEKNEQTPKMQLPAAQPELNK